MKNRTRLEQAWTIAKIELRRAFFSKRAFWVYGLALLPSVIFFGNSIAVKFRRDRLSAQGTVRPALISSLRQGETVEAVLQRFGKPPMDFQWESFRRIREDGEDGGITTHRIEPPYEARFIRLNVTIPSFNNDPSARIYEFEAYGENSVNLALKRPATGSPSCSTDEGPEKAFNGSVTGGSKDRWCSFAWNRFLQVDLGGVFPIKRVVVKHASAGGESEEFNTSLFNIQASQDNKMFTTVVNATSARFVDEITSHRRLTYFDGQREARLSFVDGKLVSNEIRPLLSFEEDRGIFAGVFQYFYLRLAVFFGCLGIFMNLFRGEMLDKTLHFWFLAPARREVLLAGKYGAGLIASTVIFAGGALLCFLVLLWTHDGQVQAYWQGAGIAHAFWYAAAAVTRCIGYGSIFLATGLLLRNRLSQPRCCSAGRASTAFCPKSCKS
jgi:hypothetical protein